MERMCAYLGSSIGKKQVMAVAGLAWCGFVLGHMLGNLLYIVGPDAYNGYGHMITSGAAYYAIEAGLLLTLAVHVIFGIKVSIDNRRARPVGYAVSPKGEKGGVNPASKSLALSGLLILVFIVMHLKEFRFGEYFPYDLKGKEVRDLHRLMTEEFLKVKDTAIYSFMMIVVGAHLQHALWSGLQTLGLVKAGKELSVRRLSIAFGALVAIGFAVNPILIFLKG